MNRSHGGPTSCLCKMAYVDCYVLGISESQCFFYVVPIIPVSFRRMSKQTSIGQFSSNRNGNASPAKFDVAGHRVPLRFRTILTALVVEVFG